MYLCTATPVDRMPNTRPTTRSELNLAGRVAVVTGDREGLAGRSPRRCRHRAPGSLWRFTGAKRQRARSNDGSRGGGRAWAGQCDVGDEASVSAFFEKAVAELGPVDILVNNAGIVRDAHVMFLDSARWNEVLEVNLNGAFYCVRAVVRGMLLRRWGRIINVSSPSARMPLAGQPAMRRRRRV